jgi:hypothetical protein
VKIFLSHASRDKQTVTAFKNRLPESLHKWLDVDQLVWGEPLERSLADAIQADVDYFVIFLAADSLESAWVTRELSWALMRESQLKRQFVLPIRLGQAAIREMPPELAGRVRLELSDTSDLGIEQFARIAERELFKLLVSDIATSGLRLDNVVQRALNGAFGDRDFWTRPMLRLPLDGRVCENVLRVLEAAVRAASQSLREVVPDAADSSVRSNVFLPTCDNLHNGDVCSLSIPLVNAAEPRRLAWNMSDHRDTDIVFRPYVGATGRAFIDRRSVGVVTHPEWLTEPDAERRRQLHRWVYVRLHPESAGGLVDELGFNMPDYLNRRVEESLAWIISIPIFLRLEGRLEVVGVFNVDCREYQIEPSVLRAIFYRIAPFAGVLSGVFRGLPFDRVAIFKVTGGVG